MSRSLQPPGSAPVRRMRRALDPEWTSPRRRTNRTRPAGIVLALLLVAATGWWSGCGSSRALSEEDRSIVVDATPAEAFEATRQMLSSRGYAIETARPDSGTMRTAFRRDDGLIGAGKHARIRMEVRVTEITGGTWILLTPVGQMRMAGAASWSEMPFGSNDRAVVRNHLSQIRQMLP